MFFAWFMVFIRKEQNSIFFNAGFFLAKCYLLRKYVYIYYNLIHISLIKIHRLGALNTFHHMNNCLKPFLISKQDIKKNYEDIFTISQTVRY